MMDHLLPPFAVWFHAAARKSLCCTERRREEKRREERRGEEKRTPTRPGCSIFLILLCREVLGSFSSTVGGESNPPHVYLKLVFGVLVEISPSCTEEAPPFHIHIAIKENQASKKCSDKQALPIPATALLNRFKVYLLSEMDSMYPKILTEPPSRSALFIKLINVLGLLLSLGIIGLGIWLATQHGDCEKPLTIIVFVIGIIFLIVSILGLVGASFAMVPILYTYLVLMLIVLVVFAGFIIFVFVVTAQGGGYSVPGQQFQEYTLHDYSPYIRHRLNNPTNWEHVRRCIETSNNCEKLNSIQSAADYYNADLNPIQSGCCRPPTECDYTIVNAGDFDTSTGSNSSNPDCLTYSNDPSIKCYDCQSCKGGVAQEIKRDGRILGIVIIVVFFLLVLVYSVGCFAGRAVSREHYSRV